MLMFLIVFLPPVIQKHNFFLSLEAEFSGSHQSLGEDKDHCRWEEGSALWSAARQQASTTGRLWRWCGLDLASSQVHKVDRFQLICCQTEYAVPYDLSDSLHIRHSHRVEQVSSVWSTVAAVRLCNVQHMWQEQFLVPNVRQQHAVHERFLHSSLTFATVCCSPSGYRDAKQNESDLISGPEAHWHGTAWTPAAKTPYSPTQSSHTWIAFGDGSQPMLALDQHPGIAWETPHRHAPKPMPTKDCANDLLVQTVLTLLSIPGQVTGRSSVLGQWTRAAWCLPYWRVSFICHDPVLPRLLWPRLLPTSPFLGPLLPFPLCRRVSPVFLLKASQHRQHKRKLNKVHKLSPSQILWKSMSC